MIPLRYAGAGEFQSLNRAHASRLDKELVIGEVYTFERYEPRSAASHRHYHALINDAWQNLPEAIADDYPSPIHLRKTALIKCGYATKQHIICKNNMAAVHAVAGLATMDTYAIIEVSDNVLTIWRATSQNMHAMGKTEFQESKDKVLHWISNLIGADIAEHGGKAA